MKINRMNAGNTAVPRIAIRDYWNSGCKLTYGFWAIAILLLTSCQDRYKVIWHPTPANIQTISDPDFVLREDTSNVGPWIDLLSRVQVTIGVEESQPLDMIGQVSDMAVGLKHLYYTDFIHGHVREYDFLGNLTAVIGKRGQGPGEFPLADKVALSETENEAFLVVAGSPIPVSVFRKEAGVWIYKKTFTAMRDLLDGDLCAMHGHVYAVGYSEGAAGVIHKYTLEGEHVLSFGEPYIDPDPFIRSSLSERGELACNAIHHMVAYRHELSPVITGFSDTGNVQWQVELADADIGPVDQTFTDEFGPTIGFRSAPSRTGRPQFISTPDSESFLVQYGVADDGGRLNNHHIYSINATTGKGVYAGRYSITARPRIRGIDSQHLYTLTYDPYPQIGIHARSTTLP